MSFPNMDPSPFDDVRHVTEELSEERCWELLCSQDTGRFGFNYKNRVMILPVSYLVHDRAIYFRTSAAGTIGDAVPR
ncbi:pyridoxamine 5'-phosphate oxidase family protein [Arthrobacter bambusae]|uniref:Nitroimidazol reductase NimA-like FMN-containing flavoprotein (Pyridoxamine 5'-phosphate oxidase superfamily) n=2 Tax=Arthrobacter bambusae TaxID=1338426 RepID=A0AAW8DFR0_9MICC|nr:pyridoxamine 5'-phosphate oxidase family protein [Arthrobacter bambusae]MDP9904472.1 nitroimidazol reductase NimA-like FMN-containing flavoprotein (pyridoxamine 5'-phosphate oxidase superfamily) [Arthrobacter bambusae]MDQ0127532.1 nitroimidazol reductase NimA-like FMN-containing flavoprotein (pyridoxamine 5'-phosphate oxidase superfamily) [Arthrobacter bambusae]MDQ0178875.1 nitroimidazol reductase NimA-like FMN-containing flavoprotein (pyridoxamine 5'-phosphate oxidase superfamily) [Arthrobac